MEDDYVFRYLNRTLDDDISSKGSRTTIITTDDNLSSYRNAEGPYWDDDEESHPYTMAGIGLTGEDEDSGKVDKIKSRASKFFPEKYHRSHSRDTIESEEIPDPSGPSHSGQCCEIRYASEDDGYIKWLKSNSSENEKHHHKSHFRKIHPHSPKSYILADDIAAKELQYYDDLKVSAYKCVIAGEKLEQKMLSQYFQDIEFSKWAEYFEPDWLPKVPEPTNEIYSKLNRDDFLHETYSFGQHYNWVLDWSEYDQKRRKGPFEKDFHQLIIINAHFVVQYTTMAALVKFHINKDAHPEVVVKSDERREMKTEIGRAFRDYLTVTQFIKMASHLCRGYCYQSHKFR